jgi:hypothetical protein
VGSGSANVKVAKRGCGGEDDSSCAGSLLLGWRRPKSGTTKFAASSGAGGTDSDIYEEPLGRESLLLLDHGQFDGYYLVLGGT